MLDADIANGIGNFVLGWMKHSTVGKWWRYLFALTFSGLIGFLEGFGIGIATALGYYLAGKPITPGWALVLGLGGGAAWARICMVKDFRAVKNDLMKDITVVLPQQEANDEFKPEYQTQTITKQEK